MEETTTTTVEETTTTSKRPPPARLRATTTTAGGDHHHRGSDHDHGSRSTTTTAKPTTTTAAATTTTTRSRPRPTTTREADHHDHHKPTLPPTTSTSYIERPPVPEVPGNTYLDERNNGDVVYAIAGGQIVLTLGGDLASPYTWSIKRIDTSVLRATGNPMFTPVAGREDRSPGLSTPGRSTVLRADVSTQLALAYADSSGNVNQYFYVGLRPRRQQVSPDSRACVDDEPMSEGRAPPARRRFACACAPGGSTFRWATAARPVAGPASRGSGRRQPQFEARARR